MLKSYFSNCCLKTSLYSHDHLLLWKDCDISLILALPFATDQLFHFAITPTSKKDSETKEIATRNFGLTHSIPDNRRQ